MKIRLLNHFLSELPFNFAAAFILETGVNEDLVGYLSVVHSSATEVGDIDPDEALVKDVDTVDYYVTADGAYSLPPFFALELISPAAGSWRAIKDFYVERINGNMRAGLSWSRNNFAKFANHLLYWLENGPEEPIKVESMYGYVFDRIRVEKPAKGKSPKVQRK